MKNLTVLMFVLLFTSSASALFNFAENTRFNNNLDFWECSAGDCSIDTTTFTEGNASAKIFYPALLFQSLWLDYGYNYTLNYSVKTNSTDTLMSVNIGGFQSTNCIFAGDGADTWSNTSCTFNTSEFVTSTGSVLVELVFDSNNGADNGNTVWIDAVNLSDGTPNPTTLSTAFNNVFGSVFQQTIKAEEFYELHSSPINSTNTNITLVATINTTSPFISSANDSGQLDFAVKRDGTVRTLIGGVYQESTALATFFPATTITAIMNVTDSASGTRIGVQDNGPGWAAGFNTNGVANEMTCTGVGGVASGAFSTPTLTDQHNYTVRVFPGRVDCLIDGVLLGTIAHTNGANAWRNAIFTANTGINLNESLIVTENALPTNSVTNVNSNGTGRFSYNISFGTTAGLVDWFDFENNQSNAVDHNPSLGFNPTGAAATSHGNITWKFNAPAGFNFSDFDFRSDVFCSGVPANRNCTFSYSANGINWVLFNSPVADGQINNNSIDIDDTQTLFVRYFGQAVNSGFRPWISNFHFSAEITNISNTNLPILVPGNNTLNINQSSNASDEANITFSRNDSSGTNEYNVNQVEGASSTTQKISHSSLTEVSVVNVTRRLYYDNVNMNSSWISENNSTKRLNATALTQNTTHSFYWITRVHLSDGSILHPEPILADQFVYFVNFTDCTAGGAITLNYTPLVEENVTELAADINVNFDFRTPDGSINRSVQFNVSNVINFTLCLPPGATTIFADSFMDYSEDTYPLRYHFLRNATLTTTMQTIPLMLEPEDLTTDVQIITQTTNQQAFPGLYVQISRYFPSANVFLQVAQVLTGASDGKAVVPLRTNDIYYQFIVTNATGTILGIFTDQSISCPTTPCTVLIPVTAVNTDLLMYTVSGTTSWGCAVDNSSVNCTVVDTSGLARGWNLTVYRPGILNTSIECQTLITTSSGALSCSIPVGEAIFDNFYELQVNFNPGVVKESGQLSKSGLPIYGLSGVFAGMILILGVGLVTISNPSVSVLGMDLAFVVTGLLGLIIIPLELFTGMVVSALAISILMRT